MKTFGKLVFLAIFFGVFLWTAPAAAGEAGIVSCSTPDCGYHFNLKIGGGMRTTGDDRVLPVHQDICQRKTEQLGRITGKLFRPAPIVRRRSSRSTTVAMLPKSPVPNAAI